MSGIDWITCTIVYPGDVERAIASLERTVGKLSPVKAVRPYALARGNEIMSVYWHDMHPEFKMMLRFDGAGCAAWRNAKPSGDRGLLDWLRILQAEVTRLDFAVDLLDKGAAVTDAYYAWECNQLMTTSQAMTLITGQSRTLETGLKGSGDTLYIGSRQSERFVRIYDKAAQSKIEADWIRIEIELKGERAKQMAREALKSGVIEAGIGALRTVIEWTDIEWLEKALTVEGAVLQGALPETETDRERWLREVVLPAVALEAERGNQTVIGALRGILEKAERKGSHGSKPID